MDSGQTSAFGTQLRRARRAACLTQEEVAERAGVSVRTIRDLEHGISHTPRADTVTLLSEALGLRGTNSVAFLAAARQLRPLATSATSSRGMASMTADNLGAPFVGRRNELTLVERHLAGEGPPVLLLAGEPGIGKSRILHAAIPRASGIGLRVLEGGCQQRGGQEPYAPFLGAFQRHLQSQRPSQLREDLQGCAWLVRLLPELANGPIEPLPAGAMPPEHERRLLFAAVTRFLTNVAGHAGTLLLLDDLQWAGEDALDLLSALARASSDVPLRIIGAYRTTEVSPEAPLAATLTSITNAGLASRRLLSPLSAQESAQLLDELLIDDAAEERLSAQVVQRAGGVPFFLVSCAQYLRHGAEDCEPDVIPWDVEQSVRQRITSLPEQARQLLGLAAVIGRTVPYRLLQTVAARSEYEVLDALDSACHAYLLEEVGGASYRFTHDLIREVVEASLGSVRRMLLHRDIARALQAQSGVAPVEELAYHYARGDQPEQALPYLARAAERASVAAAYQDAVALLAQAIGLAKRVGREDLLGDLHASRGTALFHLTRWAEAREEMLAALERVPPERGALRAEILIAMAKAGNWNFFDAAAIRRFANEALALAEVSGREDLAVAALSALVIADSADGQLHTSMARYRRAAERSGGRYAGHLAAGAQFAGLMQYWRADYAQAILLAREAIALGRSAHDSSSVLRAQADLASALAGSGRYTEALQIFTEGQQEGRTLGAITWLARLTIMRGGLHLELFDFAGAELLAHEGRDLGLSVQHNSHPAVSGGIDLLLNFARRGDVERAEALLEDVAASVTNAEGAHGWLWHLRFAQAQAEIALARGNHEQARFHAVEVIAHSRTLGRVKYEVAGLQVLAQARAAQGQAPEACHHLQVAVARARSTGDPAMFLRAAAALLTLDENATLRTEAQSAVERIAGDILDPKLRRCFLAAEPVNLVMRLPG